MIFFSDLAASLRRPSSWLYTTWFRFLIRYRRTAIGPLWIVATPIMFIGFLGALFVGLSNLSTSVFIPHMAIGFITWTLLGGFLSRSATLYTRNRSFMMQGEIRHSDIILLDMSELVVHFLHQSVLIVAVCLFYKTISSTYALWSFIGLFVVVLNGFWFTTVLAILGARYNDLSQLMTSITSILFLATPIIWMPSAVPGDLVGRKASVLETYMNFNPMYHFLEIIRAPLMNKPVSTLTLTVVGCATIFGYIIAAVMYRRYRHMVVLWT